MYMTESKLGNYKGNAVKTFKFSLNWDLDVEALSAELTRRLRPGHHHLSASFKLENDPRQGTYTVSYLLRNDYPDDQEVLMKHLRKIEADVANAVHIKEMYGLLKVQEKDADSSR